MGRAGALRSCAKSGVRGALLMSLLLAAKLPAQTLPSDNLGIDHFGIEDGLPGLFIRNLVVSGDGTMWLHASGMLVSFDGLEFVTHDLSALPSEGGAFRGLGAGRGDTVWVVFGRELFSYSGRKPGLRAQLPTRIMNAWQSDDGTIWMRDDFGMVRLTEDGYRREVEFVPPVDSAGQPRPDVWPAFPGDEWVFISGLGADGRVPGRRVANPLPFPDAWPVPGPTDQVAVVGVTDSGTIVTRLDGSPVTTIPAAVGDGPILLDRQGRAWARGRGRITAIGPSGDIVATMQLAAGAAVTTAAEDSEGNIWVGTVRDGLYRIRPRAVNVIGAAEGLTDGQVLRVSPGDHGTVLAVEDMGRAVRVADDGVSTLFDPPPDFQADLALADRFGTIWYTSRQYITSVLHGRTANGTEIEIPFTGIPAQLIEDPVEDGLLWVVANGLMRIRPYAADGPIIEAHLFDPGFQVRDIIADPDGGIWMVGDGGLVRYSDTGTQTFFAADGLPLGDARALHRSADGTIWIGRYGGGIVRYRDGEFGVVRAADGLWDDVVSSILEDDAGNLWMGSNRGIHRVARADLDDFLDGKIPRVRGRGYGTDAGFQNAEASGWPATKTPDGRLWFPTFSGIAVIDPAQVLQQEQATPGIRIRGVVAGGETLEPDSVIPLPRGQRRVDLAYGATLLSGQSGMRYEVLLEGVDTDWADAGGQRQVTYGSLPPGRHVFHARAISGTGVSSVNEATITLVVPPFFYETASFRLLLALIALTGLWFLYHLRVQRLRARELRLQRLVDDRTHELAESKTETEAALATVEAQARELRSLDEAKSRFFANVSHELRTPLTLVQGPLQDVLDGRLGPTPEAVREQVATVLASGRRLGELVEQLLDVARLESGELRLHLRDQDLKPLFERLAQSFDALARNRGVTFEATIPPGTIPARVDADQMEKVYGNLLSNAFKFTPRGGHVRLTVDITARGGSHELVVTVDDTGPGIPLPEQAKIFERFHQVDDSSKRVHGGAGLGLALVKEVVELHGGSVAVTSEPGKGSRFTVRVPTGAAAEPVEAGHDVFVEQPSATAAEELGAAPGTVAPSSGPIDADDTARPTVLVVEDHDELRAYLRRHLEERYRVIEAPNGRVALGTARESVPDLILCDIMMPEMDGEELCRAVRDDPELSYLPVIMLTAKASRQSRLSALEGGADDYLVKPFDPEELRLRVGNALASRRRLAERLVGDGKTLPFVPLALPETRPGHDFAMQLDVVLRERMGDEDFDIDQMADTLAMSRATLYRKADEALGMSPMEWLWKFRLEQAAHWLRETDGTVSEVAYASGFKTVPHFTRKFKAHFGMTPAAYRRRHHGAGR